MKTILQDIEVKPILEFIVKHKLKKSDLKAYKVASDNDNVYIMVESIELWDKLAAYDKDLSEDSKQADDFKKTYIIPSLKADKYVLIQPIQHDEINWLKAKKDIKYVDSISIADFNYKFWINKNWIK